MAKLTLHHILRSLRAIIVPTTALIAFSCLLTFFFVLYQPTRGPEHVQRLGWQAWDLVAPPYSDQLPVSDDTTVPSLPEGVDWWNVTTNDPVLDMASQPLDVWNPLLPHDTGLSEISIERCMFPPVMATGNICGPPTTTEKDAIKGKWVRVEGNFNAQSGLFYLNIYYRRTRRVDIPLISQMLLLPDKQSPPDMDDTWHKVSRSIRDGQPSSSALYLWYKADKTLRDMTQEDKANMITELDVLYGEDDPWYGFEKLEPASTNEQENRISSVHLTYRRGVQPIPKARPLHFSRDGTFKIMQVADLHFSVARGKCRDTDLTPCTNADNLTLALIAEALDAEKPDLVVFTGDQLNGQGSSWDARSVLAKFAKTVIARQIPWAVVFGNHDDETGGTREYQMKQLQALPYNMVQPGPKDVHGVGNYVLKVKSADPSMTHLLTLYFLDSGAYSKGYYDWFGWFTPTEYDWIHQNQIDWFLQESASINAIQRPFTPDGGKDFGDIWSRQSADQVTPQTARLVKPSALMFFHIPLPEAYNKADLDSAGNPLDVGLHDLEEGGAAKKNDGMFAKGLLKAFESEHSAGGNAREVKVVANGHCHVTENCRRVKGIWMCFGGGGSYSGYGRVGFDRRFRIYDISEYGERIETYKRTEHGEIVDRMVLAGKGAPPPYEGTR